MPEAFDPAGIITAARQIFQDAPDFLAAERDRLQLILVDDIQEANPAVFELLADIAAGKDPSSPPRRTPWSRASAAPGPDLVAELPRLLAPDRRSRPRTAAVDTHRHAPAVAEAWLAVAGRISRGPAGSPPGGWSSPAGAGARAGTARTPAGRSPPAAVPGP